MIVRRVGPLSLAKIMGALYVLIGLVIGGIISLISIVGGAFIPNDEAGGLAGVLLILTQKDNVITGTVGAAEDDQHPITSGTIDGDKVVINARHNENGREYKLELTLKDDELSGTLTSGERRAELTVKRRKDK
jgi:hypothetical protein